MNSIFSSYDAVCAELFGVTVRSAFQFVKKEETQSLQSMGLKEVTDPTNKKTSGGESSPPPYIRKPPVKKSPRFAPELDGLHCFETLVPY